MNKSWFAINVFLIVAVIPGGGVAHAQSSSTGAGAAYPYKPIRIVTSAVGGGSDFVSRLIAQGISGPLGQQVIVENRAGGVIPGDVVVKSLPDGYTLLLTSSTLWLASFLQDKVPFDPIKDFAPITVAASSPGVLVLHPSVAANTVNELIALAKAKPGALNYASAATGTANHLAAELFKYMAGVNIVRVSYKGGAAQMADLISGLVHMTFGTAGTVAPHVKSGKLKALAVTSAEPSQLFPKLPTIAVSGLPGYESVVIHAIFARAQTPAPILGRLNQEIVRVLQRADLKDKLLNSGVETVGSTPEQCAAVVRSERARMGKMIKEAGIREE